MGLNCLIDLGSSVLWIRLIRILFRFLRMTEDSSIFFTKPHYIITHFLLVFLIEKRVETIHSRGFKGRHAEDNLLYFLFSDHLNHVYVPISLWIPRDRIFSMVNRVWKWCLMWFMRFTGSVISSPIFELRDLIFFLFRFRITYWWKNFELLLPPLSHPSMDLTIQYISSWWRVSFRLVDRDDYSRSQR